jgi:hypothetical protein
MTHEGRLRRVKMNDIAGDTRAMPWLTVRRLCVWKEVGEDPTISSASAGARGVERVCKHKPSQEHSDSAETSHFSSLRNSITAA